jgi:hypothetical protein
VERKLSRSVTPGPAGRMARNSKFSLLISLNVLPGSRFTKRTHCLRLRFLLGCIRYSPGLRTLQVNVASHEILACNQIECLNTVCSILFDWPSVICNGMQADSSPALISHDFVPHPLARTTRAGKGASCVQPRRAMLSSFGKVATEAFWPQMPPI